MPGPRTEKNPISVSDFEAAMFDLDGATEFNKLLIYGDSGVGKTVLAGTAPGRVAWFAGEPGYISAVRTTGTKGKAWHIPDTATALAAAAWMEDGHAREFDWLVVDGGTTMQNKFLLGYAAEAFDANPAKRAHRNLPDKPDYFNAQNFMKGWLARLIDLPINLVVTAHAMRPEDDEGDRFVFPGFQGKGYEVANYIAGMFYCVGYLDIRIRKVEGEEPREVRRVLWHETRDARTDTKYFAKDQSNTLPKFMDNTDLPEILSIINGGQQQEQAAPATRRRKARA